MLCTENDKHTWYRPNAADLLAGVFRYKRQSTVVAGYASRKVSYESAYLCTAKWPDFHLPRSPGFV